MEPTASPRARTMGGAPMPRCWRLYFDNQPYAADDRRAALVRDLDALFSSPAGAPLLAGARPAADRLAVPLDHERLVAAARSTSLAEALAHAPEDALRCLAAGAHEALAVRAAAPPPRVAPRLHNVRAAFVPASSVRADSVGRLVTVRGTVIRATPVRPLVTCLPWACARCGEEKRVPLPDGFYLVPPGACGADGCRSRTFAARRRGADAVDWQRLQLQGLPRDERAAGGEGVPRPIDVELLGDLVEAAAPGDTVTVVGIVKVLSGGQAASGRRPGDAKRQCLFLPYVEAVSVAGGSGRGGRLAPPPGAGAGAVVVEAPGDENYLPPAMPGFTGTDLAFVRQFVATCERGGGVGGDQLRLLVASLCPGIYGQEMVKAGLLCALFGGVRSPGGGPGGAVPVRGDVHVLLVGDPGLGKSQLLQAAAAAAPRGVYVCGTGATSAGLTASVSRDAGEACLDAGALVLADRGLCAVDELDKMPAEHPALLQTMEQQEVSVAKAGLVATLPARATVLAAANPDGGAYDRRRTLLENVRMSPALLSRFDLVFLLVDRPDAERDGRLSRHVLAKHSGLARAAPSAAAPSAAAPSAAAPSAAAPWAAGGAGAPRAPPLRERLRGRRPGDEPLPPPLLRKLVAYARQYVHPVLSAGAAAALKAFYLHLRAEYAADPRRCLPVTHRALEALVRLAEARARMDLRAEVTAADAADAIELMQESLDGALGGGGDMAAAAYVGGGGGAGGGGVRRPAFAAERRRYVDALARHCERKGSAELEVAELYALADAVELGVPDTGGFIEALNEAGDLLKRGGGRYALAGGVPRARDGGSRGGGYGSRGGGGDGSE